ncbi:MAG: hypothetical protein IJE43_06650 [Alphaproteobacteria bacterium]|nr:hypothetical protein [Alphaproteobacteria bacterium]
MPRNVKTRYNNDCTPLGVAKNFITIAKETQVPKTITTSSKVLDFVAQSKIAESAPYLGQIIKAANYGPQIGANVARIQAAHKESCRNYRKK